MFVVLLLNLESLVASAIGYSKTNVWDAKTIAFEYIKNYIIENDGKKYLEDSHNDNNKDINNIATATCRHYFNINNETGNIEIFKVDKETKVGWFYNSVEIIKQNKFIISINKVEKSFDDNKQVNFSESDLNIAKNIIKKTKKDNVDNIMTRSLMGDLKEYLKTKPFIEAERTLVLESFAASS